MESELFYLVCFIIVAQLIIFLVNFSTLVLNKILISSNVHAHAIDRLYVKCACNVLTSDICDRKMGPPLMMGPRGLHISESGRMLERPGVCGRFRNVEYRGKCMGTTPGKCHVGI